MHSNERAKLKYTLIETLYPLSANVILQEYCDALGLKDTARDPMKSKRNYIDARLLGILDDKLISVCEQANKDLYNESLDEAIKCIKHEIICTNIPFGSDYIEKKIALINQSIQSNPELAVGTSKELIETLLKTIIERFGDIYEKDVKIPALLKQALGHLSLLPENISENTNGSESLKMVLRGLSSVVCGLSEFRNKHGSGHGKSIYAQSILKTHHAKLVAGSAITFVEFIYSVYLEKIK